MANNKFNSYYRISKTNIKIISRHNKNYSHGYKKQEFFLEKFGIKISEKIAIIIGQKNKILEGKFEGLIEDEKGKKGEELLYALLDVAIMIEKQNLFTKNEYREFIIYLFENKIINNDNFDDCVRIFNGMISEKDRLLIK